MASVVSTAFATWRAVIGSQARARRGRSGTAGALWDHRRVIAWLAAPATAGFYLSEPLYVSAGPGFWRGTVLWGQSGRPESTTTPVRLLAIDRRGRRRTVLSLPPERGFTNQLTHFAASATRIALQRD